MTLLAEIQAKVSAEILATRNQQMIADAFNAGRTKLIEREIGNGWVLESLGVAGANAFLDVIATAPDFRYVKPLVEQGRLNIGSALVQATIKSMVGTVLTQTQADALCALGITTDPVSLQDITTALIDDLGVWRY